MAPLQLWMRQRKVCWPWVSVAFLSGVCPHAMATSPDWLGSTFEPIALKASTFFSDSSVQRLRAHTSLSTAPVSAHAPALASSWSALVLASQEHAAANKIAAANIGVSAAQTKQAQALAWMPTVALSGSASTQHQSYNGTNSRTPASALTLNATLPIWRAAERATAQAHASLTEQTRQQAQAQRAAVARELSMAYVAAAEAAEQARLANAQLNLLHAQLRINERRLQAGIGTMLEELETRTRMEEVRANIQEWRTRAQTQRLTVARLSAQPRVHTAAGLNPDTRQLPGHLPPLTDALEQAKAINPQWLDAQAGLEAARATHSARQAEAWQPTIDAVASSSRSQQDQRFDGLTERQKLHTHAIGVQLNWPLFSGGYHHGRVQEASALLTRAEAQRDQVEADLHSSLLDAYQRLTQAQAVMSAQLAVEHTATATHEAVHKAFVAGLRTNLDLLNAQQQIYTARQNVVAARVTALGAHIDILALLDRLDAQHVGALEAQLDAQAMPEATS